MVKGLFNMFTGRFSDTNIRNMKTNKQKQTNKLLNVCYKILGLALAHYPYMIEGLNGDSFEIANQ